jgi:hypothetical protein
LEKRLKLKKEKEIADSLRAAQNIRNKRVPALDLKKQHA